MLEILFLNVDTFRGIDTFDYSRASLLLHFGFPKQNPCTYVDKKHASL